MRTDEKSAVARVRIAVLGHVHVGKSALTVRYLTRRFIGEYSSKTDLLYRQTVPCDSGLLDVEIVDISADENDELPVEQIQWADACLVVYSITDRHSFEYAGRSLGELRQLLGHAACHLVGNKADLDHLRAVPEAEGAQLAASHGVGFCEVSVAENSPALYRAFERLIQECRTRPAKQRKFSVTKMLGTLIGTAATKQPPPSQGTVVACHRGALHKSRVLQRRQAFTASGSL